MEAVYNKTRTEEVLPEMRAAVDKACAVLDVTSFVGNLDGDVCLDSGEVPGRTRAPGSCWVLPNFDNFWPLTGRRVRLLSLPDSQRRVVLSSGPDFRATL